MLWLAHALTLSRIPIAIALAWTYGDVWASVALIAAAAATDAGDGNLARYLQKRGHTKPAIGGWLDPLVDKIFVVVVLAIIWIEARDLLLIALVGAREIVMVPLVAIYLARIARTGRSDRLHADPIGKVATIAQFVALAVAVAAPAWAMIPAIAAAGLGLAAVAHYVARELRDASDRQGPRRASSARRD